jgi:hypothetical protein
MANWTDQDPATLLPGKSWNSAKSLAAFENPVAIAEGAPDAPVISQGWHPWDATLNNQSDGLVYDHAVDGSVASVETAVLAAGYEYWLQWEGLSAVSGASVSLALQLRRASDADYTFANIAVGNINSTGTPLSRGGACVFPSFAARRAFTFMASDTNTAIGATITPTLQDMWYTGAFAGTDRFDRARLIASGGAAQINNGGKVWLFRRRFETA